jgi:hypothetical protein
VVERVPVPVVGLALLTMVLRLPYLGAPLAPDEAGFLMVAHQWRPGSSLYGNYWVDRPPLLIALFRLADALGGLPALRLLGCLAAVVTVLGVGLTARRVAGPAAAAWSAAAACALLVSPLAGSVMVNGELLAAPFIATGLWLAVVAVEEPRLRTAAAAGACAVAAILVKQNMLDVVVFAGVLGLVSWRAGRLRLPELARLAAGFAAGGVTALVVVLGDAVLRGTSPGGVLFAMYPFRWRAATTVEHASLAERLARLRVLGEHELLTAAPVVLALLLVVLLARRRRVLPAQASAVAVATLVLSAYGVVSVAAGGSYWPHYLVQLAVPTALAAGLVAVVTPRLGRAVVSLVLVAATLAWTAGLVHRVPARGDLAGAAIGRVSEPGDSLVSAFGDADLPMAAHLESPYPYLWALPAHTLDPHLTRLRAVLAGPRAPTWFVVRPGTAMTHGGLHGPGAVLHRRYHLVGEICDRVVFLRDGVRRTTPAPVPSCTRPLSTWFDEGAP